jgi:hypothetical protein
MVLCREKQNQCGAIFLARLFCFIPPFAREFDLIFYLFESLPKGGKMGLVGKIGE